MKHAVYCGTRNIYRDMETAAKSLIANSDVGKVHFLIEDPEFPTELPDIIECHDVSGQAYFPPGGANGNTPYTYMTMLRAALCHELPDLDTVLSLDTDTVCVDCASGVWEVDVDGCYLAATPESWATFRPGLFYCNTGVSLFNLKKLRDGKADEIIDVLNRHYFRWPEQDAMNYLCQGRIAHMPPIYNWCPWVIRDGYSHPRIVHYAARNDWRDEPPVVKYRDMSWDEAMEMHGLHE